MAADEKRVYLSFFTKPLRPSDAEGLALALDESPELRREFFATLDVDLRLDQLRAARSRTAGQSEGPPETAGRRLLRLPERRRLLAAAVLLFVPLLAFLVWSYRGPVSPPVEEALLPGAALEVVSTGRFGKCSRATGAEQVDLHAGVFARCDYRLRLAGVRLALRLEGDTQIELRHSQRGVRIELYQGAILFGAERLASDQSVQVLAGSSLVWFRGTAIRLERGASTPVRLAVLAGSVEVVAIRDPQLRERIRSLPPARAAEILADGKGQVRRTLGENVRVEVRAERPNEEPSIRDQHADADPRFELQAGRDVLRTIHEAPAAGVQPGRASAPGTTGTAAAADGDRTPTAVGPRIRITLRSGKVLTGRFRERNGRLVGVTDAGRPVSVASGSVLRFDVIR